MKRITSSSSPNVTGNRDVINPINHQHQHHQSNVHIEPKKPIYGVSRIVGDGAQTAAAAAVADFSSTSSSSVSTSILTQELLGKSDRKSVTKAGFDSAHLKSLKDRIEQQKTAKVTKKPITQPVVRVEPTSLKTSTSTPLVRKVAQPGAPETYLGFTTNFHDAQKVTRKVKRKTDEPKQHQEVTRKTASTQPRITTSSWRANAKNAKKLLKKQETTSQQSKEVEKPKEEEKQDVVDKILSDDVKGILRELQLDVIPQTEPLVAAAVPPKKKKPTAAAAPAPPPEEEKKRHYKSEEVQQYMQKQKQKRRLEELKRIEDQRLNEAKKAREMEKLKERQLKLHRKRHSTNQSKNKQNEEEKKTPFDPYAKALEIIGAVGTTSQSKLAKSITSASSESKSDSLSLEFKPLPSANIKSPDQTELLAELDEKINAMTPTPPPIPAPSAAPPTPVTEKKVTFKRPEQTETLLASLRARSRDIDERTQFWSGQLESLKEKQVPGVQLTQQQQQMRQISPISSPPPPVVTKEDNLIHVEKVEDVVADIVTVERVLKPVSFVQVNAKDELNIVKLMYQKEKERRKSKKRKSKKQPTPKSGLSIDKSKSDYNTSHNASSVPTGDYTPIQEQGTTEPTSQSINSSINKQQKTTSSSTSITEHSLISDIQSTMASTPQPPPITESSIVTIQPHTNESLSNPTQTITTNSAITTAHSQTSVTDEITTESDKSDKVTSSIVTSSESYSKLPTTTTASATSVVESEQAAGDQLGQIMKEQLRHNDALDHNLQVIDQMQSARFLDQMRTIQETGRKAAELMLKASKNMARQADVTVTEETTSKPSESIDVYKTTTAVTSTVVSSSINEIQTGPLPDSSLDADDSTSGTITSKVDEDQTTTKQKTTTTVETVESKYTDFTEEDEESDFDRSLSMLTPSVAHQKQVKNSRKDTSDSSDLEPNQNSASTGVDDSFVKFMKKMVSEYAQNKKSSRSKFHQQAKEAKEKAHKEKHKRDKGLKKYKNKSYDEKMIKLDQTGTTDGSDTSLASNNNLSASDRVKHWLAKIPNEAALTKREQELHKRRKRAEKLLKWKRRLDEQEKSIIRIEEEAGQMAFRTESEVSTEKEPEPESMQESITTNEDTTQHTTYSETDLDQSDADIKVRVLKDKLKDKQKEARRLRAQLGSSLDRCDETVASLGKQEALRQQINRIDNIIAEVKSQISIASLVDEEPGLKPRIRSPSKDSSVSSNSSHQTSRLSSSKIKSSLPSDTASEITSPRRSALPSTSKISSVTSTSELSEDENLVQLDQPTTTTTTTSSTGVTATEAKTRSERVRDEEETKTPPEHYSMMDSSATSLLEQVSTASTVTETHEENKKDIGPVVDALVERLVGDILDDFGEDKTTLLKQLRQSSSEPEQDEGSLLDNENVLLPGSVQDQPAGGGGSDTLDDDSLIKALLDHVERQDAQDAAAHNQLQPEAQAPIVQQQPAQRTFDEVALAAPLAEPMPDSNDDFSRALWSICAEITHDVMRHAHVRSVTNQVKPWSKERFVPVSKFAKTNPTSIDDLSSILLTELRQLLTASTAPPPHHVLRKMGHSRAKKDRVDLLLIGELRQEEKTWTVYDEDEDFVMANLTESIFDLLIDDTIQALRDVEAKRLQQAC